MNNLAVYQGGKRSPDDSRRPLPSDVRAEQSVLGAVLLHNRALDEIIEIISAEDFYREAHRQIFRAMVDLDDSDQPIDAVTLSNALHTKSVFEQIGGPAYIAELADAVPTAAYGGHYARIVSDKATLRRAHLAATTIAARALESPKDVAEFLSDAEREMSPIFDTVAKSSESGSAAVLAPKALVRLEEQAKRDSPIAGLSTGFTDLDQLTGGLLPGESAVLAASTAGGKTTLALNIAARVAAQNIGVSYFSLEMSKEKLMIRLLCSEARVFASKARTSRFTSIDLERLGAVAAEVSTWPLDIVAGELTISRLKSLCRRYSRRGNLGLVVLDYLNLMTPDKREDTREREIGAMSRAIKLLAVEIGIPILLLCQLNRKPMSERRRPELYDLRDSGQIEFHADHVWFIYREDGHDIVKRNQNGIAELTVAKQRDGSTGPVKLFHQPQLVRFDNLDMRGGL